MSCVKWTSKFKLFVRLARLSGIEIDPIQLKYASERYKRCLLVYAILNWLVNVAGHLACGALLYRKHTQSNEDYRASNESRRSRDFVSVGTTFIELVFSSLLDIGVHGWLIVKSQDGEWKALWSKLERMSTGACRMRNAVYIGSVLLLSVIDPINFCDEANIRSNIGDMSNSIPGLFFDYAPRRTLPKTD